MTIICFVYYVHSLILRRFQINPCNRITLILISSSASVGILKSHGVASYDMERRTHWANCMPQADDYACV